MPMKEFKGEKLYVALGASQVRRRLKGHGFGVRKIYSDGKNRAVIGLLPGHADDATRQPTTMHGRRFRTKKRLKAKD